MKISKEAAQELARLGNEYNRLEKARNDANKQLEAYALGYMEKADMLNSLEDMVEMINHLPRDSFFRFKMVNRFQILSKSIAEKENQEVSREKSSVVKEIRDSQHSQKTPKSPNNKKAKGKVNGGDEL